MYEMLCGRPPFLGDGVGEVIAKHIYEHAEPPRDLVPEISSAVERIILQAMAKRPDSRFASMGELSFALDKVAGVSGSATTTRSSVRTSSAASTRAYRADSCTISE